MNHALPLFQFLMRLTEFAREVFDLFAGFGLFLASFPHRPGVIHWGAPIPRGMRTWAVIAAFFLRLCRNCRKVNRNAQEQDQMTLRIAGIFGLVFDVRYAAGQRTGGKNANKCDEMFHGIRSFPENLETIRGFRIGNQESA